MVERKMEKSMEEMDLEYIANSDLEWSKYKNKTIFVTGATGHYRVITGESLCVLQLFASGKYKNYWIDQK